MNDQHKYMYGQWAVCSKCFQTPQCYQSQI